MVKIYIFTGIIVFIAIILKSPWFKGWIGELQVNLITKFFLDKSVYHLIKNITIPADGGTTQIDHVIVSRFGVFVVETKNLRGWIFGKEGDAYWTQKIFRHSEKFQNPLRQNYKHTKTLSEILGIPDDKMRPVVVFIGDSTFKTKMPENVTGPRGYIQYIRSQVQTLLTDNEVNGIIKSIAHKRLAPGLETHLQHVQHVKDIKAAKKDRRPLGKSWPGSN
jgi:restriction system protein